MINSHLFEQFRHGFVMNVQEVFIVVVVLDFGEEFPAQFHLDDHAMIDRSQDSSLRCPPHDIFPLNILSQHIGHGRDISFDQ